MQIRLITFDDEVLRLADQLTAILHSRVVARKADLRLEHEVGNVATFPDEKRVAFCRLVLRSLAKDRTVFDGPEFRLPGPAREVFPVEEGLEILCMGGGREDMKQRQCREDFHKSGSSCCVASQRLIVCGRRTGRDWFLNKYAVREHVYLFGAIRVSVGRNVAAVESCQQSDRFSHRLQFARETAGDSRPLPHGVRSNAGILIIYNFFEWAAQETSCCEP